MLLAGGILVANGGVTMAKTYHMKFSGDTGARIGGSCVVSVNGGETILTLESQVPHEQDVDGNSLSCHLEADGRVIVDIEHNGNRMRSATNGGMISVDLR